MSVSGEGKEERRLRPAAASEVATLPPTFKHERQRLMLCAVHALNNAMQDLDGVPQVTPAELDKIAASLAPRALINPHKNPFGLGNYDVNVLSMAAQNRGFDVKWHDARKDVATLFAGDGKDDKDGGVLPGSYFALIVNRESRRPWYMGGGKKHHWLAIRRFPSQLQQGGSSAPVYFNLDSELEKPVAFGSVEELSEMLRQCIAGGGHVLILVPPRGKGDGRDNAGDGGGDGGGGGCLHACGADIHSRSEGKEAGAGAGPADAAAS